MAYVIATLFLFLPVWGQAVVQDAGQSPQKADLGFREKFEAKHRSAGGHFVRSKAEMLIDDGLYDEDVQNLDDVLPRHLLKFGVQAYENQ